jgi:hypothetical protein
MRAHSLQRAQFLIGPRARLIRPNAATPVWVLLPLRHHLCEASPATFSRHHRDRGSHKLRVSELDCLTERATNSAVHRPQSRKIWAIPSVVVFFLGMFNALIRELRETAYQFDQAFVMDDSAAREAFGFEPTPWNDVTKDMVSAHK